MAKKTKNRTNQTLKSLSTLLSDIDTKSVKELQALYKRFAGKETKSRNTQFLRRHVSNHVEAAIEKAREEEAQVEKRAQKSSSKKRPRDRDPRLPAPGIQLSREYEGTEHVVTVLENGFEYRGESYRSLSGIAKSIMGCSVNGFLFFKKALAETATEQ